MRKTTSIVGSAEGSQVKRKVPRRASFSIEDIQKYILNDLRDRHENCDCMSCLPWTY